MMPPTPNPIVTEPRNAAIDKQIGSQIRTDPMAMNVSSDSEQPLKIAGSEFNRSVISGS